jgi:hypothetical protein
MKRREGLMSSVKRLMAILLAADEPWRAMRREAAGREARHRRFILRKDVVEMERDETLRKRSSSLPTPTSNFRLFSLRGVSTRKPELNSWKC